MDTQLDTKMENQIQTELGEGFILGDERASVTFGAHNWDPIVLM